MGVPRQRRQPAHPKTGSGGGHPSPPLHPFRAPVVEGGRVVGSLRRVGEPAHTGVPDPLRPGVSTATGFGFSFTGTMTPNVPVTNAPHSGFGSSPAPSQIRSNSPQLSAQ
eukprot:gene35962-28859_t